MKLRLLFILLCVLISACNEKTEQTEKEADLSYKTSLVDWEPTTPEEKVKAQNNDSFALELIKKLENRTFNEIIIGEHNLTVHHTFMKPNPCTNFNYKVTKEESVINIHPEVIPEEPKIDPETGKELITGCVQTIAYDYVEIVLLLGKGVYTLNIYDFYDKENPSVSETIEIVEESVSDMAASSIKEIAREYCLENRGESVCCEEAFTTLHSISKLKEMGFNCTVSEKAVALSYSACGACEGIVCSGTDNTYYIISGKVEAIFQVAGVSTFKDNVTTHYNVRNHCLI